MCFSPNFCFRELRIIQSSPKTVRNLVVFGKLCYKLKESECYKKLLKHEADRFKVVSGPKFKGWNILANDKLNIGACLFTCRGCRLSACL